MSYLVGYAYFAVKDPDALSSEKYKLHKMAIAHVLLGDSLMGLKRMEDIPPASIIDAEPAKMGGAHHELGLAAETGSASGEALAFQPLRDIDIPAERAWALEWIVALLAHEKIWVTPEIKESV